MHPNREGHRCHGEASNCLFFIARRSRYVFLRVRLILRAPLRGLIGHRMALRRDAWLTFTGHTRPGIAKGLPMDEANPKVQDLTTQITAQGAQPFPGKISKWNGSDRYDFPVGQNKTCSVIVPEKPLPGKLWAWKGEFLDAFPKTRNRTFKTRRAYRLFEHAKPARRARSGALIGTTLIANSRRVIGMATNPL